MSEASKKHKLVLVGYMGSGKTTIGRLLAKKLKLKFFDLDSLIEEKSQMSISDIFAKKGEATFRDLEAKVLDDWMTENNEGVLASGGGTPCYRRNMNLINKKTKSIWLKTSIQMLVERLIKSKSRPLVEGKNSAELKRFIRDHLRTRRQYYNQSSIRVMSFGKSSDVVERIISKL